MAVSPASTWCLTASATSMPPISRRRGGPRSRQAGYTIVANMGDQPSDLAGGHAERAFLLPNPFYRIP